MHTALRMVIGAVFIVVCATACSSEAQPASERSASSFPPSHATAVTAGHEATQAQPQYLLPDSDRWVVVEVHNAHGQPMAPGHPSSFSLDISPVKDNGTPDLAMRVQLQYSAGPINDFEREMGDAAAMTPLVDIAIDNGVAKVAGATNEFSSGLVWRAGTFVALQHTGVSADASPTDLAAVITSLRPVESAEWQAALAGADAQVELAVAAAIGDLPPNDASTDSLPHYALDEPWQLQWVTDKTIWTDEQHQQEAGLIAAHGSTASLPLDLATQFFDFSLQPDDPQESFLPDVLVHVARYDEAPDELFDADAETIWALGLDGTLEWFDESSAWVAHGSNNTRIQVQTRTLDEADFRDFLRATTFWTDNPLDGVAVADSRFSAMDLAFSDERPPSWHAAWATPQLDKAQISMRRMTVDQLRNWLWWRSLPLPADDIWQTIASRGTVTLGDNITYDVAQGLLLEVYGVERSELLPIELDDWIELVEQYNADPLHPR